MCLFNQNWKTRYYADKQIDSVVVDAVFPAIKKAIASRKQVVGLLKENKPVRTLALDQYGHEYSDEVILLSTESGNFITTKGNNQFKDNLGALPHMSILSLISLPRFNSLQGLKNWLQRL